MKIQCQCYYCGVALNVAYWKNAKSFCNIHCYFNWQVADDLRLHPLPTIIPIHFYEEESWGGQ